MFYSIFCYKPKFL